MFLNLFFVVFGPTRNNQYTLGLVIFSFPNFCGLPTASLWIPQNAKVRLDAKRGPEKSVAIKLHVL